MNDLSVCDLDLDGVALGALLLLGEVQRLAPALNQLVLPNALILLFIILLVIAALVLDCLILLRSFSNYHLLGCDKVLFPGFGNSTYVPPLKISIQNKGHH